MSWRERAACTNPKFDPDWWFPTNQTDPDVTSFALNVCDVCPVRKLCADRYDGGYGIWGGKVRKVWIE